MPILNGANSISNVFLGSSEITKVYLGSQLVYKKSTGTPLSELSVGTIIYTTVNNVRSPFLIIHQGNPNSSYYGAGGEGTWLMYQDYSHLGTAYFNQSNYRIYSGGTTDTLLNTTLYGQFQSVFQNAIHSVSIEASTNSSGTVSNWKGVITRKVFLPSWVELGSPALQSGYSWNPNVSNTWGRYTGTVLSAYSSTPFRPPANSYFWTRSIFYGYDPDFTIVSQPLAILQNGTSSKAMPNYTTGYAMPILVVDDTLLVDSNMDIIL